MLKKIRVEPLAFVCQALWLRNRGYIIIQTVRDESSHFDDALYLIISMPNDLFCEFVVWAHRFRALGEYDGTGEA